MEALDEQDPPRDGERRTVDGRDCIGYGGYWIRYYRRRPTPSRHASDSSTR